MRVKAKADRISSTDIAYTNKKRRFLRMLSFTWLTRLKVAGKIPQDLDSTLLITVSEGDTSYYLMVHQEAMKVSWMNFKSRSEIVGELREPLAA